MRTLAATLGTSPSMVQRVWKVNGHQPHCTKTFKLSNDPRSAEKLVDLVGVYLNRPGQAIVLWVDVKSHIQALDRAQKSLPMYASPSGTLTHDCTGNGTITPFATLIVTEGIVIEAYMSRHRHQERIKFLEVVDGVTDSEVELHRGRTYDESHNDNAKGRGCTALP